MVSQKYEAMLDHMRTAAVKNQVGEEFEELGNARPNGAGDFSFAQEAYHLRVIAALVKVRLAELGERLEHVRTQSWSDGEYKYKVSTISKTKMVVEPKVLELLHKELYDSLQITKLDESTLRKMIEENRISDWQKFVQFVPSAPYVSTGKEVLEQPASEIAIQMDEEVQA